MAGKLNGFSLFMRERRPQLEAEGKTFPGGWKDVAECVNNDWKELTEDKREDYRQRSKRMSGSGDGGPPPVRSSSSSSSGGGHGQGDLRRTSLGMTFQEIKDKRKAKEEQILEHYSDLKRAMEHGNATEVTFVIINFSIYGQLINKVYVPAELGLTAFNVKQGIIDNYCTLIDPYELPKGIGIEALKTSKVLAVPFPPFDNSLQNYERIANILEAFLDRHKHVKIQKRKLYCLSGEMQEIQGCLDWLYNQIPERRDELQLFSLGEAIRMLSSIGVSNRAHRTKQDSSFVIKDLMNERRIRDIETSTLMSSSGSEYLSTELSESSFLASTSVSSGPGVFGMTTMEDTERARFKAGVFYHEKQVEQYLNSFNFAFDAEIGCPYHLNVDEGLRYCALNITNRYAYNVLDAMITIFGITPRLSYHIPDIRDNPEKEAQRRKEMLQFWGHQIFSPADLKFDYKQRDPKKGTVYPDLGPNRPK